MTEDDAAAAVAGGCVRMRNVSRWGPGTLMTPSVGGSVEPPAVAASTGATVDGAPFAEPGELLWERSANRIARRSRSLSLASLSAVDTNEGDAGKASGDVEPSSLKLLSSPTLRVCLGVPITSSAPVGCGDAAAAAFHPP
jgi:hypothetical protein